MSPTGNDGHCLVYRFAEGWGVLGLCLGLSEILSYRVRLAPVTVVAAASRVAVPHLRPPNEELLLG